MSESLRHLCVPPCVHCVHCVPCLPLYVFHCAKIDSVLTQPTQGKKRIVGARLNERVTSSLGSSWLFLAYLEAGVIQYSLCSRSLNLLNHRYFNECSGPFGRASLGIYEQHNQLKCKCLCMGKLSLPSFLLKICFLPKTLATLFSSRVTTNKVT